jgi:hypothetical protein
MFTLFESMGASALALEVPMLVPNVIIPEGLSGGSERWYMSQSLILYPSSIICTAVRLLDRIKHVKAELNEQRKTRQMVQLYAFKGLLGTPVNHNNVHWGFLVADDAGILRYCDSLGWGIDMRIKLMGQLVCFENSISVTFTSH